MARKREVKELEVGEEGFVMPWALKFNFSRIKKYDIYLDLKFPLEEERRGLAKLCVKRTGLKRKDFEVDLDGVRDYVDSFKNNRNKYGNYDGRYIEENRDRFVFVGRVSAV